MPARMVEKFIPLSHPNRPGTALRSFSALVLHYTANDAASATAEANQRYFARRFFRGPEGLIFEADGKSPFRYGSAQVICDEHTVVLALPLGEAAWACGDTQKKAGCNDIYGGQLPLAKILFKNQQNHHTVSVEICNNGDWLRACAVAQAWIIDFLRAKGVKVNLELSFEPKPAKPLRAQEIVLLRHGDLTGKNCPAPFMADPAAWRKFATEIAQGVGAGR